jgi:hypothetical protein
MHALTRDCPLTCLELPLSAAAYNALRFASVGPHPTVGDVVDLYLKKQLADLHRIGVKRSLEIEACLAGAGLIGQAAEADAPVGSGQLPPVPPGWSGTSARRLGSLLVE